MAKISLDNFAEDVNAVLAGNYDEVVEARKKEAIALEKKKFIYAAAGYVISISLGLGFVYIGWTTFGSIWLGFNVLNLVFALGLKLSKLDS